MINETVPIALPDGGVASVVVPVFTVAYATSPHEEGARLSVALKTPSDPSAMAAFRRAKREYPDLDWVATSGANTGAGAHGADHPYWSAILALTPKGSVELRAKAGDPMIRDAYRAFSDREATSGLGEFELAGMLKRMEDADPEDDTGFSSSPIPSEA